MVNTYTVNLETYFVRESIGKTLIVTRFAHCLFHVRSWKMPLDPSPFTMAAVALSMKERMRAAGGCHSVGIGNEAG